MELKENKSTGFKPFIRRHIKLLSWVISIIVCTLMYIPVFGIAPFVGVMSTDSGSGTPFLIISGITLLLYIGFILFGKYIFKLMISSISKEK